MEGLVEPQRPRPALRVDVEASTAPQSLAPGVAGHAVDPRPHRGSPLEAVGVAPHRKPRVGEHLVEEPEIAQPELHEALQVPVVPRSELVERTLVTSGDLPEQHEVGPLGGPVALPLVVHGLPHHVVGVPPKPSRFGHPRAMDVDRLHDLLGAPALARLRHAARWRLERDRPLGVVRLPNATQEERRAVGQLLGRKAQAGASLSVDLVDLQKVLRFADVADNLREAIEHLDGPIEPLAALRAAGRGAWAEVDSRLEALVRRHVALEGWAQSVRSRGLVRRWSGRVPRVALSQLAQLEAVLAPLPIDPTPLGWFAGRVLRDSHALDVGRPLRTMLLSALEGLHGAPPSVGARGERALLAAQGLLSNDLLSQVLVLNLPGAGPTATDALLAVAAGAGEPVPLPLGMLERMPPRLDEIAGRMVSICENPWVVVAAARRLGVGAAPLVCVRGRPTVAVLTLLGILHERGARLRYHGDFDWPGIEIAEDVRREVGWTPWRYDAGAYEAAVRAEGANLMGSPRTPSWDPALGEAMRRHGKQVEEEAVLDDLVDDLARGSNRP